MTIALNPTTGQRLDVFGPTVELLSSPHDLHNDFCVMRGVIPPSGSLPLHSHADTEDFSVLSGQAQALKHVPGCVPHAWRNVSSTPLFVRIFTTTRMGRFFRRRWGR